MESTGVASRLHEKSAAHLFEIGRDVPGSRPVHGGDVSFEPGVDLTSVDDGEGIEFDSVLVPDATAAVYPLTDDDRLTSLGGRIDHERTLPAPTNQEGPGRTWPDSGHAHRPTQVATR